MKIKRTSTWNVAEWPGDIQGHTEIQTAKNALMSSVSGIEFSNKHDLVNRRTTNTTIFADTEAVTALKSHPIWQSSQDYNLSIGMTLYWLKEEEYNELTGEWVLIREGTEQF